MLVMFLLVLYNVLFKPKKEKKKQEGVPCVIQGKSCVNMQIIEDGL